SGDNGFSGAHQDGDLLVVSDYTNGGSVNEVVVYEWTAGALSATPVATGGICGGGQGTDTLFSIAYAGGSAGTDTLPPTAWAPNKALEANEFVESGIDLNTIFPVATPCFSHFLAEARSSQSRDAELHDFAGGTLNTCRQPTLATQTKNASDNSST